MAFLIAIFSILWGILVCIDHYWNIWLCIPIGLGFFILIYGFFWLCMFSADKIVNHFSKVYNEKVIPRIKQKAINEYKEENPQIQPTILVEPNEVKERNLPKQHERLTKFLEKCEEERKAFVAKKEEEDAEKLEKILLYARNTLRPFDFTDEELFQGCEAIRSLVIHRVVLTNIPRTGKKTKLTKHDLSNFGLEHRQSIRNFQFPDSRIPSSAFSAWFKNTEVTTTLAKNLRKAQGRHNIEIDTNILDKL